MNRSGIPDIEPWPYYPQSQGKHERSNGTWYNKQRTWYNSFINKLINHE